MRRSVQKRLFVSQVSKHEVDGIKRTVENNGYARTSRNDYTYEGAFVTHYEKKTASNGDDSAKIGITLNFKRGPDSGTCSNFGITIANASGTDLPATRVEMDRIEEMLYQKLLKTAGRGGVERSNR